MSSKSNKELDNIELLNQILDDLTMYELMDLLWSINADEVCNWIELKDYIHADSIYDYCIENYR